MNQDASPIIRKKILLTKKSTSKILQSDPTGHPRTIQVEVRKKRTFINLDDLARKDILVKATDVSIDQISPQIDSRSKKIRWKKLKSIEISNFKAIKNIHLPLSEVTVLVGPNGSGKSSVLQAIHWATRAASYIPPKAQSEVVSFERLDYSPSRDGVQNPGQARMV